MEISVSNQINWTLFNLHLKRWTERNDDPEAGQRGKKKPVIRDFIVKNSS